MGIGYVRIDNSIGEHPRVLELDDELYLACVGLYVLLIGWSDAHRTDGAIPAKAFRRICPNGFEPERDELLRVGLLRESDEGFEIHDYLDWQRSSDEIEARSEKARSAARAGWDARRNAKRIESGIAKRNAAEQSIESRAERKEGESLKGFPECMSKGSFSFTQPDGSQGKSRSGHGHILHAVEQKTSGAFSPADLGLLGAAITKTCRSDCGGMLAFECTRSVLDKIDKAHTLKTAISFVGKDKR